MNYKPVIGMEVHIELDTKSKMFSFSPASHFGIEANTHTDPVSLGLPGALPYPNQLAIDYVVMFGLSLGCEINKFSKFDRKHYFYPDLPKSYQISQYDLPFCEKGTYLLPDGKSVRIKRVHLEEDTAKLIHKKLNGENVSLVDFNRSGVPLVELVTEPDFDSVDSAISFLREIQTIIRYLGISNADMEKGSMRLEANISVSDTPEKLPDYKVELKNINSFKFLEKALKAEIERQTKLLQKGQKPKQETRGYDEAKDTTFMQRSKEDAEDYRYFPEPDIPPIVLTDKYIKEIKDSLPELHFEKKQKYLSLGLSSQYVEVITKDKDTSDFFEEALVVGKKHNISADLIAKMMVNQKMHEKHKEPSGLIQQIIKIQNIGYSSSSEIQKACGEVIKNNPEVVSSYRDGKVQVIGFLIGQVQKLLKGKGDPKLIKETLERLLQD